MPGNFLVICGPMVGENHQLPALAETPAHRKNGLIRKTRLTSKFMTSQAGLQTIAIHALPNMSKSKGNQTMKFGQLLEYNKRNVFL